MIHRDSSKETLTGHHVFIESNIRVSCNRSQHPTLGMISWDVRWCSPLECLQYAVLATHVSPLDVPFRNTSWTTLRCQHGGPAGKSPNYFNGNIIQLNGGIVLCHVGISELPCKLGLLMKHHPAAKTWVTWTQLIPLISYKPSYNNHCSFLLRAVGWSFKRKPHDQPISTSSHYSLRMTPVL